jgi:histone-lysine N-methyltransferase SETMAR
MCSVLLAWYEQEGETFLKRIITGDESYMHFFTLECKRASSEWRHQISTRPKKVSSQASAGKVLLTVYWDHKGVILEHYLEQRETINSERYSDMLQNQLKPAIRTKHRSLSSSGVCLQHDNA